MFKGLKYCALALVLLVVIIFFVIKSSAIGEETANLLDKVLDRKPKASKIIYKEEKNSGNHVVKSPQYQSLKVA